MELSCQQQVPKGSNSFLSRTCFSSSPFQVLRSPQALTTLTTRPPVLGPSGLLLNFRHFLFFPSSHPLTAVSFYSLLLYCVWSIQTESLLKKDNRILSLSCYNCSGAPSVFKINLKFPNTGWRDRTDGGCLHCMWPTEVQSPASLPKSDP